MSHTPSVSSRAISTLGPVASRAAKMSHPWLVTVGITTMLCASALWALLPVLWITAAVMLFIGTLLIAAWFINIAASWPTAIRQLRDEATRQAIEAERRLRELQAARKQYELEQFDAQYRNSLSSHQRRRRLPWDPPTTARDRIARISTTARRALKRTRAVDTPTETPADIAPPPRPSWRIDIFSAEEIIWYICFAIMAIGMMGYIVTSIVGEVGKLW